MVGLGWMVVLTTCMSAAGGPKEDSRRPAASQPMEALNAALELAVSEDGSRFVKTGQVLLRRAGSPDLLSLPNSEWLAVFEHSAEADQGAAIWASRSKDDGKSWLPARAVRLEGLPDDVQVSSPSLVLMPSGLVRMYFAVSEKTDRARARATISVASAVTRDGLEFRVDRAVCIDCPGLGSVRLSAFWGAKQLVLMVTGQDSRSRRRSELSRVQQYLSRDGRAFYAPDGARLGEIGHVVQLDAHHWRMYITAGDEIRSRMSNEGTRWRGEPETCLKGGTDAAVVRTGDGKYTMLFCTPIRQEGSAARQLAAAQQERRPSASGISIPTGQGGSQDEVSGGGEPLRAPGSTGSSEKPFAREPSTDWESFTTADFGSELGGDAGQAAAESPAGVEDQGFAPLPDFQEEFDYIGWFRRNILVPDHQNAYESYAPVLEQLESLGTEAFSDLYHDARASGAKPGPPGPWTPADHPDWEASFQATRNLLEQFGGASLDGRPYRSPPNWPEGESEDDHFLMGFLLPSLAQYRRMTRATLSQAWRAEAGIVPPEQMREALETCLGNANHLRQGATLIERLVAHAERQMVHENARWALHQNVFPSADEVERTLQTLREKDLADPDPAAWMRGEHAAAMDLVQHAFVSVGPGGPMQVDEERVRQILRLVTGDEQPVVDPALLEGATEKAKAVVQELDSYYRYAEQVWRSSWPGTLVANPDRLAEEINERNRAAGSILPSTNRAYLMMRRTETERRATQLAYSLELFKSRNGRYPTLLDELPYDQLQTVRTDPFSGQDFAYRLSDSGPVLYSFSEDGSDDGGVHSVRWAGEDGGPADFVFWPPQ